MNFLAVALGGAIGAAGRYAISLMPVKAEFPVLTLITNVLGAILIGFIAGVAAGNADTSENAVLFWKTGVCGGFTTFSTFSLEALTLLEKTLLEKKAYLAGSCYIILSVVFCLAGVICGRRLAMLLH